jgi:hypothetical protein
MSFLILDLFDIPQKTYQNCKSYYTSHCIIPIHSCFQLYYEPYHHNSSYIKRDIFNNNDFNKLLHNQKQYKPQSNKTYNIGNYYIPDLPPGRIISHEIIPVQTKLYNIIPNPYYITQIILYTTCPSNIQFSPIIKIYRNPLSSPTKTLYSTIECVASDISISPYFTSIVYLPLSYPIIDLYEYYEIDLHDFNIHSIPISSRNNIQIQAVFI